MKHVYSLTFSEGDFSTSIVSILLVSSQVTWGWLPWLLGVVTMVTAGIFAMVTAITMVTAGIFTMVTAGIFTMVTAGIFTIATAITMVTA